MAQMKQQQDNYETDSHSTHSSSSTSLHQSHPSSSTANQSTSLQQSSTGLHKRSREEEPSFYGNFHHQHKEDNKQPIHHLSTEYPSSSSSHSPHLLSSSHPFSSSPSHLSTIHPLSISFLQAQQRGALLPDPDPKANQEKEEGDVTRLPSIKQMKLDTADLESSQGSRSRHWEYYPPPSSSSSSSSSSSTAPIQYPSPSPSTSSRKAGSSSSFTRSPLKTTQSVPPPLPQSVYTTELVPVKTNTYGFVETTFTNVPPKRPHRRRPAHVDKDSLYCHTCGSKSTPEWRRGPAGPATLCNACGLAYAKRLKQDEEALLNANNNSPTQKEMTETFIPAQSPYFSPVGIPLDPYQSPHGSPYLPSFSQTSPHGSPHPSTFPQPFPFDQSYDQAFLSYEQAAYLSNYKARTGHSPSSSPFIPSSPSVSARQQPPRAHTFHQYTPTTSPRSSAYHPYQNSNLNNPPLATTTTTTTNTTTTFVPIVNPPLYPSEANGYYFPHLQLGSPSLSSSSSPANVPLIALPAPKEAKPAAVPNPSSGQGPSSAHDTGAAAN